MTDRRKRPGDDDDVSENSDVQSDDDTNERSVTDEFRYDGPQRRSSDIHLEVLKSRLDRTHEDIRDLRDEFERYVLKVELMPLKLIVFGGVAVILLGVVAAMLLTVLKR